MAGLALTGLWVYEIPRKIAVEIEYKKQLAAVSEEALGYIREKYGFEALIIDDPFTNANNKSRIDLYCDLDGYDGIINIILKMEANGREFYADVTNYKYHSLDDYNSENRVYDNFWVCDTYQYKDIKSALEDKVSESFPGGRVIDFSLGDMGAQTIALEYFDIYYEGSNLDEVMQRCSGQLEMVFPDVRFSQGDIIDRLCQTNIDVKFTSFDTADKMEEFIEAVSPVITTEDGRQVTLSYTDNTQFYEQYKAYINDRIEIEDGEIKDIKS